MKTLKTLLSIFVLIISLSFVSCENEPIDSSLLTTNNTGNNTGGGNTGGGNTGGGNTTPTGVFKVSFDGQTFIASSTQAIVNNTTIALSGLKPDGSFFQITLLGTPAVGTYNNTNSSQLGLAYSSGSGQIPYLGVSNSSFSTYPNYTDNAELKILTIDTANRTIKGTFQFNGGQVNPTNINQLNIKNFTNGEFNLTYTTDVPTPTNNSFFAKLDGVNFNPTNITGLKSSGFVSIIGRRGSVENIGLSVADNITAGTTVNFSPFSSDARGQYILDNNPMNIFGGTGSITIISHNTTTKRIKGTFNFNAETLFPPVSNRIVTEGTFDVTYL